MRHLDCDIVMLALPRWDGPYSSTAYSLAKALSKHVRVFYVDNPVTVKEYFVKRNTEQIKYRKNALLYGTDIFSIPDLEHPNLFTVTPRLTLPINWLNAGFIYDSLSKLNDAIVSEALNKVIKMFAIRKYILVNSFNPLFGRYPSLNVKPELTVYQSVDDISQSPYLDKHGPRLEDEAVRKADFTIVTSTELKRLKSAHSEHVYLLPNAANVSLFQRAAIHALPIPAEIQALPRDKKIIVYTGNICHRLDYELLVKIAKNHCDKILLMVGPFANLNYKTAGLDKLPNVVFTGRKKIDELPAYLQYSDCTIIPFLCNQLTKSIYPLKINEYLSAGKPVVTTNFSEDIASFRNVANVAENHDEFLTMIDKAIYEDTAEERAHRISVSSNNNWEARAHHFIEITGEFLKQSNDRRTKQPKRGVEPATQSVKNAA
jgi:teichuronic acid biosynthesis glycosyltransferase TuaH